MCVCVCVCVLVCVCVCVRVRVRARACVRATTKETCFCHFQDLLFTISSEGSSVS